MCRDPTWLVPCSPQSGSAAAISLPDSPQFNYRQVRYRGLARNGMHFRSLMALVNLYWVFELYMQIVRSDAPGHIDLTHLISEGS